MEVGAILQRTTPGAPTSGIAAMLVDERDHDAPLVSIPRPEVHLVARFGPAAEGGLDLFVFGVHARVRRKVIRAGQRTVMARLALGAPEAVLGVTAAALTERIVRLDELWGAASTQELLERLACTTTTLDAAAIVERTLAERLARATCSAVPQLAVDAAARLARANVNAVADDLGVSERHLRRVFRETLGVSPKVYARLTRFHRALGAARDGAASWADIAAAAGYYDQAHLIAEFRAIAGVTPRALLGELRGSNAPSAHARAAHGQSSDTERIRSVESTFGSFV